VFQAVTDDNKGVGNVVESLAEKVAASRFRCQRCGKCCKSEFGDNTVTIFPSEIRTIMKATGLEWLDVVRPNESQDMDDNGQYHTFEWALRRKSNGECRFLEDGKCVVYEHRPFICRTYPMRLESGRLEVELYDCEGVGAGEMDECDARRMAEILIKRQRAETMETVSLMKNYEPFHSIAPKPAEERVYVVHDSEGSRKVLLHRDGSHSFV
jgi:hypothetical protein